MHKKKKAGVKWICFTPVFLVFIFSGHPNLIFFDKIRMVLARKSDGVTLLQT